MPFARLAAFASDGSRLARCGGLALLLFSSTAHGQIDYSAERSQMVEGVRAGKWRFGCPQCLLSGNLQERSG